jgi:hypothetical protein
MPVPLEKRPQTRQQSSILAAALPPLNSPLKIVHAYV